MCILFVEWSQQHIWKIWLITANVIQMNECGELHQFGKHNKLSFFSTGSQLKRIMLWWVYLKVSIRMKFRLQLQDDFLRYKRHINRNLHGVHSERSLPNEKPIQQLFRLVRNFLISLKQVIIWVCVCFQETNHSGITTNAITSFKLF